MPDGRVSHTSSGTSHDASAVIDPADTDRALVLAWRAGNARAGEALVRRYVPTVRSIARTFAVDGVEGDLAVMEGMAGLMRAVFAFDPCGVVPFASTAALRVAEQIQRSVGRRASPT